MQMSLLITDWHGAIHKDKKNNEKQQRWAKPISNNLLNTNLVLPSWFAHAKWLLGKRESPVMWLESAGSPMKSMASMNQELMSSLWLSSTGMHLYW